MKAVNEDKTMIVKHVADSIEKKGKGLKIGPPWWVVFLLPLSAVWAFVPGLSPFVLTCCVSLTLFGLIKLHVLLNFGATNKWPASGDIFSWLFLWPGLNAKAFFRQVEVSRPNSAEWVMACGKVAAGAALLLLSPRFLPFGRLVAGWAFLMGLVFILHFGSFHLAALFWRSRGRNVRPIMKAPVIATSVSDFWSKRWNLAFRDYAHPFVFSKLAKMWSPTWGVVAGYFFSGVIHELAISVPANGGYGLPTVYFTIQGLGILAERKAKKAGWKITSGFSGWCWTALITAPTALMLFHPPFIEAVVMPIVESLPTAIGT